MDVKTLHSIDEVLHYGSLGEVEIITGDDWLYLGMLFNKGLQVSYSKGLSDGQELDYIESDYEYECDYE